MKEGIHTPTPWEIESYLAEDGTTVYEGIYFGDKRILDFDYGIPTKEDIEFLIKAVNSNEMLLDAAKKAKAMIEDNFLQSLTAKHVFQLLEEAIIRVESKL